MGEAVKLSEHNRTDDKLRFIELRAKGTPYSKIAKELNVSKGTLTAWNKELNAEISALKKERLEELYDSYFMLKESRIQQLGETLQEINDALIDKDLSLLSVDRLLDYKIRLMNALKEEYIETEETNIDTKLNAADILKEFLTLLYRLREGSINKDQAMKENAIVANMLKAFEATELQKKIEALEAIIGGRDR